jgi:hypothetical protein
MMLLLFILVVLIFTATILITFLNVAILIFGDSKKSEQPEVNTVNQFQNFTP